MISLPTSAGPAAFHYKASRQPMLWRRWLILWALSPDSTVGDLPCGGLLLGACSPELRLISPAVPPSVGRWR